MNRQIRLQSFIATAIAALAVLVLGHSATASVFSNGNVILVDGPTTPDTVPIAIPGAFLPVDGNFFDPFAPDPPGQIFYEGIVDIMTPADPLDDTNRNVSVVVGQTSFGTVLISGESALRDLDLIIGDIGTLPTGQMRRGTGVVRITGFGSVFNNDPNIFPIGLTESPSPVPRPMGVGYDVYVGREGTGTLEISLGGRAEVEDGFVVAYAPGSTGTVIVDGVDSFLGSGGFLDDGDPMTPNNLIVGRRGLGLMNVLNGGQVVSEAPTETEEPRMIVGASIGSDPFDNQEPEAGGQGIVTVMGFGSKWVIGGSLQVGGFHDADEGLLMGKDFEGDDVIYTAEAGRGTLRVEESGIVNVVFPVDIEDPDETDNDLLLAIGRFGRVELNGGYISVGAAGELMSRSERIQVINDGLIAGTGRIDTGVFRNRYLGRVQVGPTESLVIDSSSVFLASDATDSELDDEPLSNFGLIEVQGTSDARAELEFLRAPSPGNIGSGGVSLIRPFLNRRLGDTQSGAFEGGLISAQHATLRFESGIFNEGAMVFSEGMNVISGRVDNIAGPEVNGLFQVMPNTTVVIEDDFSSGGVTDPNAMVASPIVTVNAGGTLSVVDLKSFTLKGSLTMEVSLTNPSKIIVSGDVGLRGDLFVSFASDALTNMSHGDAFELIQFGGDIGNVDDVTDPIRLRPDLALNPVLNVVPSAAFQALFPNLDLITVQILQSMYLMALDPSMVGPPGGPGAMGPDFNGDGVVNLDDLAVWQANVGITMGASVLQGDADGDGDVDGDDFLIWQANIGPFPGAGAGAGNGLATSVPEPGSLMILFCGGLLALAVRARR